MNPYRLAWFAVALAVAALGAAIAFFVAEPAQPIVALSTACLAASFAWASVAPEET
jgi:hypothetical protein